MKTKKGFTLIELLIVIAIIGILAVAFLPTLLGAPAKGRDTARIADLQKIQKVLVNGNLEAKAYPTTGCITGGWPTTDNAYWIAALGGALPKDPGNANLVADSGAGGSDCGDGQYYYKTNPNNAGSVPSGTYSFGLYARVELAKNANAICASAYTGTITAPAATVANGNDALCYAVLTQ